MSFLSFQNSTLHPIRQIAKTEYGRFPSLFLMCVSSKDSDDCLNCLRNMNTYLQRLETFESEIINPNGKAYACRASAENIAIPVALLSSCLSPESPDGDCRKNLPIERVTSFSNGKTRNALPRPCLPDRRRDNLLRKRRKAASVKTPTQCVFYARVCGFACICRTKWLDNER